MIASGYCIGGKYEVQRLLGEGGMGQVFEARNLNTGRRVAIKVLLPEYTRDPSVVQRFLREARAATSIHHPNVVDILDLDVDPAQGTPYIVQEYLVGESLEAYLEAQPEQRVSVVEAMRIVMPVLSAMAAAHRLRVVHRDLKPANIFLARGPDGGMVVKVIDFGIARLGAATTDVQGGETERDGVYRTGTGLVIGTPGYMSPEQAAGASDLDVQSDVWSLGVVLYELLTGRLPYEAPNANLMIGKLLYEAPTPITTWVPTLPSSLVALVERSVCKERARRFASAVEMSEAAARCELQGLGEAELHTSSSPPPVGRQAWPATVPISVSSGTLRMEASTAPISSSTLLPVATSHPPSPPKRTAVGLALAAMLAIGLVAMKVSPGARTDTPSASPPIAAPPQPAARPAPVVAPSTPVLAQPVAAPATTLLGDAAVPVAPRLADDTTARVAGRNAAPPRVSRTSAPFVPNTPRRARATTRATSSHGAFDREYP